MMAAEPEDFQPNVTPPEAKPTPPKSVDKIRATLAAIHDQAPTAATTGPLIEGLKPEDQLVIASFYDREVRVRFQELLSAHSIGSSWERRDGRDQVLVDMEDREQAARLRNEHALAYPDRIVARHRRIIDFAMLGGVLGATVSTAFVADRSFQRSLARWEMTVLPILAFTLYGTIVGGLLGALKERFVARGRLQFTILDLLLLSALVALAALVREYLRSFWRLR
ncbi:MAG: hypothetical protein ACREHD_15650 [Pirellulales bacterium]